MMREFHRISDININIIKNKSKIQYISIIQGNDVIIMPPDDAREIANIITQENDHDSTTYDPQPNLKGFNPELLVQTDPNLYKL